MSVWGCWLAVAVMGWGGAEAQRLPANVRPEHYSLKIAPDIATASFTGSESIDVVLAAPARTITLNALELKIGDVTAAGQVGGVSFDATKEQATLTFARALPAGHAVLAMTFKGVLNDKLRGFYLSKTKERNYAVTQFESTDARRAFPCFDEPALKATFDVALTVDAGDLAISNTNVVSDTPAAAEASASASTNAGPSTAFVARGATNSAQDDNGLGGPGKAAARAKHTMVFATTPKMSTYLLAFLVGDFACSSGKSDGVPIRVCSTPDKVELTKFALKGAEHFLVYYDTYFGIKYPMPKLDLIGIPDFEAGAMENFGAITYRETALLVDEKDSSVNTKKQVASTVAHEMAHQWFGDMVTMQWWDNLWLNEGFATWMENKAADEWHPEWHFGRDTAEDLNSTLNYDAVRTTRTIRAKAETPAEIAEMFDGIAYGKAGAVIGMVENWVGPEVFRTGVHNYLAAHLYGNATAEDFWNAQTATSRQPVDKVMSSFVDRPGVPLLTFRDNEAMGLPMQQRRFYLSGERPDEKQAGTSARGWTMPVCVKTNGGPQCKLVTQNTAVLDAPGGTSAPFYANAGAKGYYRVQYAPNQVKAITAVAETRLTVEERMGFLGDRWALTRAGQGSVGDYLDLALAVKEDKNAQVLDTALTAIGQVRSKIATAEDRTKLNAVVRAQFGPVYAALGRDKSGGSYDENEIRTELFEALGAAEDPAVLAHARELTEELFAGKKTTEPDILDASVALAVANADEGFYERILIVSEKSDDPGLQQEALELLARFRSPELVVRTLEYATSGKVRNQDSWILIAVELSQAETRGVAWPWVQGHWDRVKGQLTTASGGDLVAATGSFCTVEQGDEVRGFFATHKVESSERALAKALDSIDDCVRLRSAQEPNLRAWLARR